MLSTLCILIISLALFSSGVSIDSCSTVSLIHLIPASQNQELSGWNKTELKLIHQSGQLAAKYINRRSDLLPGLNVDVLDSTAGGCGNNSPLLGWEEVFQKIVEERCILGVVGLYCSRVTQVIATHLSHPDFGYIQLSSSTSPLLQDMERYPHLFRFTSSSVLFNRAVIKMMDEFNWKNIGLIYDFSDVFFRSTGINFAKQIQTRKDLNSLGTFNIRPSRNHHEKLKDIIKEEYRVNYFSITHKESSEVLCYAYHHKYFGSNYAYIFADDSLEEILNYNDNCTRDELLQASEGIILLLNRHSNTESERQAAIYYKQYKKELKDLSKDNLSSGIPDGMQYYANIVYDQIWAFAFALNNSLNEAQMNLNGSLNDRIKLSPFIRGILAQELKQIHFEGASGSIAFNDRQEVLTVVDVFQVINGTQVLTGEYNPHTGNLTLNGNFKRENVPEDSFKVERDAIPLWLGFVVATFHFFFLILFSTTCVHIMRWRNAPEIKSTGVRVNILTLSGCFLFMMSFLFFNLENFSDASDTFIAVFCNLEYWLFLHGLNLVLVTLMFRLVRVFVVFYHSMARRMFMSDHYLFVYISIISLVPLLFLIAWTAVDHLKEVPSKTFSFSGKDTHYTERFYCSSGHTEVWTSLYYIWILALLIILLILAIKTRHVKYNDFKDTKKIGAFVYSLCFMLGTLPPLVHLERDVPVLAYILKSLLTVLIPLSCLAFLYLPKLLPVFFQKTNSSSIIRCISRIKNYI